MFGDNLEGGLGWGREVQEGGDMYVFLANSHCCTTETNTTHKAVFLPLKINLNK